VDELYRVDFVAFWDNHRYAILIDDISHYATKRSNQWLADEESYSDRLREDRKLQTEGWRVYRVSNWEIRDSQRLEDALLDLRRIVGFQENAG
jgi:very-short-patch-repair endonuclease